MLPYAPPRTPKHSATPARAPTLALPAANTRHLPRALLHASYTHATCHSSYGVGAHVKLPGPNQKEPNVYKFGTPYKTIHDDLLAKVRHSACTARITHFDLQYP